VPGGVTDLDTASDLFVRYGVLDDSALTGRSAARATYHALVKRAGSWTMPLAVRQPMSSWDFTSATAAMTTVDEILTTRDQIEATVGGLSLDDTAVRRDFEDAETNDDLESVLDTLKKEASAADVVARAVDAHDGARSMLESVGLIGTDVDTKLKAAQDDLAAVKPDRAASEAQEVIDAIDRSGDEGMVRAGLALGMLFAALLLVLVIGIMIRRQRRPATAPSFGYGAAAWPGQGYGYPHSWPSGQAPMAGPQPGQWPAAQPGQWPPQPGPWAAPQPGQWSSQSSPWPAAQPGPWPAPQPGQWSAQSGPWPAAQPGQWPGARPSESQLPTPALTQWQPQPPAPAPVDQPVPTAPLEQTPLSPWSRPPEPTAPAPTPLMEGAVRQPIEPQPIEPQPPEPETPAPAENPTEPAGETRADLPDDIPPPA
jgi:hypothetical protein